MAATRCSRPRQRIWGYETPDGSFAQFCRVQSRQLMPRPKHLTWEESRLLHADARDRLSHAVRPRAAHALKPGDNVLVWGASGGLGVFGVQLCAASGANAIGVDLRRDEARLRDAASAPRASSTARTSIAGARCPTVNSPEYTRNGPRKRASSARRSGTSPASKDVDIVFEHPGRADLPGVGARGEARRHGGVLRRHDRLQPHLRRALSSGCARSASRARISPI